MPGVRQSAGDHLAARTGAGVGMTEYAQGRYRMLGNASDWFPGLNAAHVGELNLKNAVRRSPFADSIPTWLAETHEMLGGETVHRLSASG